MEDLGALSAFRHEHKYIETDLELTALSRRLGAFLEKDRHITQKGYYLIRSLYFDDYHDVCLNENIDGVDERHKWRIRIYDRKSDYISLERKSRKSDLISKQSCAIGPEQFQSLLAKNAEVSSGNPALLNRFIIEMRTKALHPAVIVEYEREPFVHKAGNVRITIDRNMRSSPELDALLADRPLSSRPFMKTGENLLEVKFDAFLPDHIAHAVETGRMRRETFSKYYLARKFPYHGL
ncbi:MAG: polyphosphate polymerase domain-containing protein [Lachnospiraceae bacterium]|nr:polyphosphate polymerase domain-containing protein [Lachnospiraceae bacterium]